MSVDHVPGHVEPGGVPLVWTVPGATIVKASVSEQDNNCYVVTDRSSGSRLVIDAADAAGRVLELLAEGASPTRVAGIVTTHRHWDHHRALAEVAAATGAPVLAGEEDASALPVGVDRVLRHGDSVAVGELELRVVALRGHTPGSVALALAEPDGEGRVHLFTGDSLFPGGPGRTRSPEEFASLMDDLEARVFGVYGDDTLVYPGHGDNTTLGAERPRLGSWRARGW